jgi:hypothetical protein
VATCIEVPGKFGLRVGALEIEVPDVVRITGEGIQINYDPAGPPTQELLVVNSASIEFPKFGVRGMISP